MNKTDASEKRQAVVIHGHALEIIAVKIFDGEWSLGIENKQGIRTQWCEFFESADEAIQAGRRALETEPIDEFVSSGFPDE